MNEATTTLTRANLQAAIATAFEHTAPGGVALFQPDFIPKFRPVRRHERAAKPRLS